MPERNQQRKFFLFTSAFFFVILFGVNFFASKYEIYWITNWLDVVSHTVGGFAAALLLFYFLSVFGVRVRFLYAIIFSLLIGAAWEVFEVKYGISYLSSPIYISDTVGDLICDVLGGIFGYLFYKKYQKSGEKI